MVWSKLAPSATDSPCNSTSEVTGNWSAWTTWIGKEHYNMANALSGCHKPGIVSMIPTGTYAAMTATTPGTGGLWWDTTYGGLNIYTSAGVWQPITTDHYSRVILTAESQSLNTGWNLLAWTESIDTLGEYTAATNILTVVSEGYYLVKAQAQFPASSSIQKGIAIYKDGTLFSQSGNYGANVITVELNDVVYCPANTTLSFYAYAGSALTLTKANLFIVRLS